ncbi:MAG: hypothetical protein P9M14_04415 [Candidatus Alcyoniella australis]|nr:hypothetical protein [Candidatus Alcyoniella australis]
MVRMPLRCVLGALALLLLLVQPAWANYLFTLESETVDVWIRPDASLLLDYQFVFQNSPSVSGIDVVDVGLPQRSYSLSSFEAWVNNNPVNDIRPSEYVDIGVEVHLEPYIITRGAKGTVRVRGIVEQMVYPDDYDENYVSVEFVPTTASSHRKSARTAPTSLSAAADARCTSRTNR